MSKWKPIARYRWVSGATITESRPNDGKTLNGVVVTRFTATIRGWRNWNIYEGVAGDKVARAVQQRVREIRDRLDSGDKTVLKEKSAQLPPLCPDCRKEFMETAACPVCGGSGCDQCDRGMVYFCPQCLEKTPTSFDEGISFETQLREALGDVSDEELARIEKAVAEKIERVTENIDRVVTVNGAPVAITEINGERVSPRVDGDDIVYFLLGKHEEYYYPIRYARIGYAAKPVSPHSVVNTVRHD